MKASCLKRSGNTAEGAVDLSGRSEGLFMMKRNVGLALFGSLLGEKGSTDTELGGNNILV